MGPLWMRAYRRDIDLPPPPPGMSQDSWDVLIFCDSKCEKGGETCIMVPFYRRFCVDCVKHTDTFTSKTALLESIGGGEIIPLLPYVITRGMDHDSEEEDTDEEYDDASPYVPNVKPYIGDGDCKRYYLSDDVKRVRNTLNAFKAKIRAGDKDAMHEMKEFQTSSSLLAKSLAKYNREFRGWLKAQILKRREAALSRLSQKYDKEDFSYRWFLARPTIETHYKLNDREWARIGPDIEEEERMPVIHRLFTAFKEELPPLEVMDMPSSVQLSQWWPTLKALLDASHDETRESEFRDVFDGLAPELGRQRQQRRISLASLLPQVGVAPESLALATSVFTCRACVSDKDSEPSPHNYAGPLISWEAIRQHRCKALDSWNAPDFWKQLGYQIVCQPLLDIWGGPSVSTSLNYNPRGAAAVKSLAELVRLDPASAVPRDFDRIDARFVCAHCPMVSVSSRPKGKAAMSWRKCVLHWVQVDHGEEEPPRWDMLASAAAADIRRREVGYSMSNDGVWRCNHPACNQSAPILATMRNHLRLKHGVVDAQEDRDMFFALSFCAKPRQVVIHLELPQYQCCRCLPPKCADHIFHLRYMTQHLRDVHSIDGPEENADYRAVELLVPQGEAL
ncbi:hypothetical protein HGRIS_007558 [Hohenbuehelia grisea]|uniref:C2H2-type domain-containing protein n=1 Tax=Hohenbuehelia grisea TaxID=104357 RepID=A0ABR3J582_9AGAR